MPVVQVDGLEVAYERRGSGPPLVLAHGAASDGREWRAQLDGLAGELTIAAWDEPGAGHSSDPVGAFGLSDFADTLGGLIEALELAPAHVGGISWGGVVVLELYGRRPDLVGTLVLADTYAGWKGSLPAAEVEARLAGAGQDLEARPDQFRPTFPHLFAREPDTAVVAELQRIMAGVRPESVRRALDAIARADHRDLLPRIAVPTLLVWGEEDARSPLAVAWQFHDAIPGAELVTIPRAGHMSNLEQPALFNQAVRDFCRAHPLG